MVRDVRHITLSSTYRDLQEALMSGQLKTLALVESTGETVLTKWSHLGHAPISAQMKETEQ